MAAKGSTTKRKHKRTAKEKAPSTLASLGESDTNAQPSSSKRPCLDNADNDDDDLSQSLPKDVDSDKSGRKAYGKRNPIYHFYEEVPLNASGHHGTPGDKHYKCFHGSRKVLTITKAVRSNLNGLIGHIKTHFPPMYRLFKALKNRLAPLTNEELLIAAGKKILDQDATSEFLKKLERSSKTVIQVFNEQNLKAADKAWDQKRFETLLTEWMVVCDQPFEEVDRPEF